MSHSQGIAHEPQMNSALGLQYDRLGIKLHALLCALRHGYQVIAQHIDQSHLGLQEAITFPDAAMRPQAKGHVSVGRVLFAICGGEAFRLELTRLRIVLQKGSMERE